MSLEDGRSNDDTAMLAEGSKDVEELASLKNRQLGSRIDVTCFGAIFGEGELP